MRHNASSNYNLWVVTLPQAHTHIYTHSNSKSVFKNDNIDNISYVLNADLCSSAQTSWGQFWGHIGRSPKLLKNTFYEHSENFYGHHIWISCATHTHLVPLNTAHPAPCILLTIHPHTLHLLDPTQPAHPATFTTAPPHTAHPALIYILKDDWLLPLTSF